MPKSNRCTKPHKIQLDQTRCSLWGYEPGSMGYWLRTSHIRSLVLSRGVTCDERSSPTGDQADPMPLLFGTRSIRGSGYMYYTTREDTRRRPRASYILHAYSGSYLLHPLSAPLLHEMEPSSTFHSFQPAAQPPPQLPRPACTPKGSRGSTPIRFSLVRPSDLRTRHIPHVSGRHRVRLSGQFGARGITSTHTRGTEESVNM